MSKNIIICSDGTGQAGLGTTNVWRLFTALDLNRPDTQIARYDPGVGTSFRLEDLIDETGPAPGAVWPSTRDASPSAFSWLRRPMELGFGAGLFQNVRELYEVLVDHAEKGDRIYLFGFSRGAFTVRVLAGLLHRCGVLERMDRYREALELYRPHLDAMTTGERERHQKRVDDFKHAYTKPWGNITFMGLWDTVKSVGYLRPKSLPHTRRNPSVGTVRHALSIGEARSFFVPTTWSGLDADSQAPPKDQDIQEIWFPGVHSDVGGGYERSASGLSTRPLRWIGEEAIARGLIVDETRYGRLFEGEQPWPSAPNDELEKWGWRVSERLPRWELENDPPPPKRRFRWGPSGHRDIGSSARGGKVQIDSSARRFYDAQSPLWAEIESGRVHIEFVDTIDRSA